MKKIVIVQGKNAEGKTVRQRKEVDYTERELLEMTAEATIKTAGIMKFFQVVAYIYITLTVFGLFVMFVSAIL